MTNEKPVPRDCMLMESSDNATPMISYNVELTKFRKVWIDSPEDLNELTAIIDVRK